jgi:hypothetical protein
MSIRFTKQDHELLISIAEHHVLTTSQILSLHPRNERAMRRRLHDLEEAGVVRVSTREFGHGRGRPEKLVSLTEEGVAVVRDPYVFVSSERHARIMTNAPEPRDIEPPEKGNVVAIPLVGGLHHRYTRAA